MKVYFFKSFISFFTQKLHNDVIGVPWKIRFCHMVSRETKERSRVHLCEWYTYI